MLLAKLIRKPQNKSLPPHLIVTEEHLNILKHVTRDQNILYKRFYHPDPEELVLQTKFYLVVKEYENGKMICYSIYTRKDGHGKYLREVIYPNEVNSFMRKVKKWY
jgi:hypothetical protein